MVLTFIAPLLVLLGKTNADGISLAIALYGIAGIVGSIVAARIVGPVGPFATSLIFAGSAATGMAAWSIGAGAFLAMLAACGNWGFGFSAINSLQQARLVLAAPALSAGAVALNTSVLYIGQSIGSTVGGVLFERGQYVLIGYLATAIMLAGVCVLLTTRPRKEERAGVRECGGSLLPIVLASRSFFRLHDATASRALAGRKHGHCRVAVRPQHRRSPRRQRCGACRFPCSRNHAAFS